MVYCRFVTFEDFSRQKALSGVFILALAADICPQTWVTIYCPGNNFCHTKTSLWIFFVVARGKKEMSFYASTSQFASLHCLQFGSFSITFCYLAQLCHNLLECLLLIFIFFTSDKIISYRTLSSTSTTSKLSSARSLNLAGAWLLKDVEFLHRETRTFCACVPSFVWFC